MTKKAHASNVASLIREIREERGESLRSAARNIGVDASHLARVESGEKQLSAALGTRISHYYEIDPDGVYLAAGHLPPDIVEILLAHPEELDGLRERYGTDG
ncbi:MAG: helix-turn-helix transcriptional regulator [Acidimicrobiales bacterium]